MSYHNAEFCRMLLKVASQPGPDPERFLKAEVQHKIRLGGSTTYVMHVTDHRDPQTGTHFPSEGQPGHFRSMTYEVEACCAAYAKVEAINTHNRKFYPDEAVAR